MAFVKMDFQLRDELLPKLHGAPLSVLIALGFRMDREAKTCYPSITKLMADTGYARQHVIRAIHILEDLDCIRVQREKHEVSHYEIVTPYIRMGNETLPPSNETLPPQLQKVTTSSNETLPEVVTKGYPNKKPSEQEPLNKKPSNKNMPDPLFDEFWRAYPNHLDRAKCLHCWNARKMEKYEPDDMIRAAQNYAEQMTLDETPERFIKRGSTFLGPDKPFLDWIDRKAAKHGRIGNNSRSNKGKGRREGPESRVDLSQYEDFLH